MRTPKVLFAVAALAVCVVTAACNGLGGSSSSSKNDSNSVSTVPVSSLPGHEGLVDTAPKRGPRTITPEVYLRTYVSLFGAGTPAETEALAKGTDKAVVFDTWGDYLNALGLPDYTIDIPRASETNSLMLATFERLGNALCDRAAEREIKGSAPPNERHVFAFDAPAGDVDLAAFEPRFDVLHRTFLGYPAKLAPGRVQRFFQLFQDTVTRHGAPTPNARLSPTQSAWASVCYGLIRHPEFQLY